MGIEGYLNQLIGKKDFIKPLESFGKNEVLFKLNDDRDVTVGVSGDKGMGKSTFVYWSGGIIDKRFSITRNYIFKPYFNPIRDRIFQLENKSTPIIDEGIKSLYRQNWYMEVQKSLYQMFTLSRAKHQCVFICIPQFQRLRTDFREDIINYWIHIPIRGLAVIMGKSPIPFETDRWNMKQNLKIFKEATKKISLSDLEKDGETQVDIYEKIPNYIGHAFFPKMPPPEQEIYDSISNPAKYALSGEGNEEAEPASARAKRERQALIKAVWMLKAEGKMPQKKIAEELQIDDSTISIWMSKYRAQLEKAKEVDVNANAVIANTN